MDILRKLGWLPRFAPALVMLPALYVASFGPACRCIESDSAAEWFETIYDPLAWLT